jgi:hypothetical protein
MAVAALSAAAMIASPPPAGADELVAATDGPTKISAYGGRLVWSAFDVRRKVFALMTRAGGQTSRVGVPAQKVPFDVDLGPGRSGHVVAVYSRCARPSRAIDSRFSVVGYASARDCDLYRYDFVHRRERRLGALSTRSGSEFLPSIWRGRFAFARRTDRSHARIYVATLKGRVLRSFAGGPSGPVEPSRRPSELAPGPLSIDLRGRDVAYTWSYYPGDDCPGGDPDAKDDAGISQIRVNTPTSRRVLAQACSLAEVDSTLGATWAGGAVLYATNRSLGRGFFEATVMRSSDASSAGSAIATVAGHVTGLACDQHLYGAVNLLDGFAHDHVIAVAVAPDAS